MSFVQPSGNARIRILGCETPPPTRRRPSLRLVLTVVTVAAIGVLAALASRSLIPAPSVPVAAGPGPGPLAVELGVTAIAASAAQEPSRLVHKTIRAAATVDMAAAARVEARRNRSKQVSPAIPAPASAPAQSVPAQTQGQAPSGSTNPPASSGGGNRPNAAPDTKPAPVVGPELPPGPMSAGVTAP